MSHLKRLAAPPSWRLKRKEHTFTMKPHPGPQRQEHALPLAVILRDMLGYIHTTREGKKLLNDGKILVNGKARKDYRFAVGIFDVIALPQINAYYIMLFDKTGKLYPEPINKEEAEHKVVKIIGKKMLSGKKLQINLFDGRNLLAEAKGEYIVGDTLVITSENKIKKHLRFEKGATIYLIGGKHKGKIGVLEEIKPMEGIQPDRIIFKTKDGKIETLQEYAYIIEKPFTKQ